MTRRKFEKSKVTSFYTAPLSGCFNCMTIFCTPTKLFRVKIVLTFNILLYCEVSHVFRNEIEIKPISDQC